MSEFGDRPFIAGSLTGVRSFKVDSLGRLTGVNAGGVWRPDLNVAVCTNGDRSKCRCAMCRIYRRSVMGYGGWFVTTPMGSGLSFNPVDPPGEPPQHVSLHKHRVGEHGCTCGFYAYFDTEANPYHATGQIQGLIRGYGTVTVGTRGFRASKADLVALIDERPTFRERIKWSAKLWANLVCAVVNLAAICFDLATPSLYSLIGLASAACLVWNGYVIRSAIEPKPEGVPEAVRRNYPDVPTYPTLAAALKDHPLTPPAPLTPDADPEFWTRSAS